MNENNLKQVSDTIISMIIKKNRLYNNSVFEFGNKGIFIRLFDKVMRLKNIYDNPDKFNEEDINKIILNSVSDILGYSLIWLAEFIDIEDLKEYTEKNIL